MDDFSRRGFVERRRHKVYITKNTEYHLRNDTCVGIKSCRDGSWIRDGKILMAKLVGAVERVAELAEHLVGIPEVGKYLLFVSDEGEFIVTTKLENIDRPPKEAVSNYIVLNDDLNDPSIQFILSHL